MTEREAIKKVVDLANSEVGYKPSSGKNTKYAAYMDNIPDYYNGKKNGFDWCDVFVDYIFAVCFGSDIGRRMLYQPKKSLGAGVGYSADYFKDAGAFRENPEIGSQIFFGINHTGIVVDVEGDTITTVEGNTGGGNGEVQRKKYNKNISSITGYGIPNWHLVKKSETLPVKNRIEELCADLAKKSYDTIQGKYGNGAARVKALGSYYTPVQWIVNKIMKE